MKIHEYQAKLLLKEFNVPIPLGEVASTPDEALQIARKLGKKVVIKAQIHAGGRGKGGGVKVTNNHEEVKEIAGKILGMKLITHQTGPEGKEVRKVLVEEAMGIIQELYLGIVIDRSSGCPVIMASRAGGMEIEEVAATAPEKIIKETVDPAIGLRPFQAKKLAFGLELPPELINEGINFISRLYNLFVAKDCSLAEINPLVITADNRLLALDAKINVDDNAIYRQKEVVQFRDLNEEEPLEIEASKFRLNYIKLNGNVGCMVNGAGLAMATMDIIKLAGAEPANFLDVGGGASKEMVENAFRILLSDPHVKAVLINIFGGILRCDVLAEGVVEAASKLHIGLPIVVRMEGTNVEQGREILEKSGLKFTVAKGMKDAAEKVVAAIK
ncbi:MAG: ADP-forming succinate--CoA ligase subunit beta [Candidatus Tectomicrobia bacterium]|uniref:Succinate--CoA ligase [ADP-forming] subunit beta n=1 Tax=Tectimicrobiota bacterium TaxID=2528274 RepID=A0A933LQ85_UNCTE|nr:ADP-forming succinate--CoA ligase subunit beta [Candidatus Tectomicrobia bacterium]